MLIVKCIYQLYVLKISYRKKSVDRTHNIVFILRFDRYKINIPLQKNEKLIRD